jgi:hypothetical protein
MRWGAWALANQTISVGFPWRRGRALNTPIVLVQKAFRILRDLLDIFGRVM